MHYHDYNLLISVTHIKTLTVYSKYSAPGEKPRVLYIHEQRVTIVLVHILVGKLHKLLLFNVTMVIFIVVVTMVTVIVFCYHGGTTSYYLPALLELLDIAIFVVTLSYSAKEEWNLRKQISQIQLSTVVM